MINAARGLVVHFPFPRQIAGSCALSRILRVVVLRALASAMVHAKRISAAAEDNIYADEIIFCPRHALPAHRPDAMQGRPAPVSQHLICSSARATSTATTKR